MGSVAGAVLCHAADWTRCRVAFPTSRNTNSKLYLLGLRCSLRSKLPCVSILTLLSIREVPRVYGFAPDRKVGGVFCCNTTKEEGIMKKTKIVQHMEGVIAWAGIVLAVGLVAFFMLYPTCVFTVKLILLLLG